MCQAALYTNTNFAGDSRECEVSRCYIHDTCGGVWMYGGDRKTLQSSGNVIANNEITRYARVGAVGNEAITLIGVGVTAKNNHIYDGQYAAINFGGNDIIIENNLVHHVCKNVSTCGAIHTGSDWTYRGNAIQYNIVHHILNPFPGYTSKAVLLDSQASGTNVMYNALYDNTVHVMIGGGRYNNIANNVMYNAGLRSIEVDRRGISDQMVQRLHAMPYKSSVWSLRYPHLADIDNHNASLPEGNQIVKNVMYAAQNTEYIHGIPNFLRSNLSRYYNISQTGFSSGSGDHYNVSNRDLRVKCYVNGWANLVNFKQPPSPNAVGPLYSPTGPTYLKRGRLHLVSTKYPSVHCAQHPAQKVHPVPAYLPDGSRDMYHVEKKGCWVNVTKCKNHTASIGTYRDMYGERYHNATENVTMCFHRALEQWKLCGSHKDEFVVAIYGRTGAATLGGTGCMTALYGCPNHGGPADGHANTTYGKYQHDYGKYSQDEKGCLANARNIWHWCGSSPNYPVTNIYLPTGAKRTAGAGCWITLDHCPAHTRIKTTFYDAIGSTNYQTDDSEFACINRAEYYWHYCGSTPKYPVTATFRPTTVSRTYPCDDVPSCLSY
ncbi:uncharacterized protein LOC128547521 [Mercenaria mercenaria]|uniref:uncharacterized protein LOC128547521 n=1 Tax=Mercenaria mercenaria TaxID=6596 RepID=UPI00234F12DE|nr:uncharacterized protein LOC128547521 [Mercenaria mercenaria]